MNRPIISTFIDIIKIIKTKKSRIISLVKQNIITIFKIIDIGFIKFYFCLNVS